MTAVRDALGIRSRTVSAGHSVCLGFSVDRALASQVIDLPYGSGVGYVSIFPMPGETRVNVFSYRALTDPWTRRMSQDPIAALTELVRLRPARRCPAPRSSAAARRVAPTFMKSPAMSREGLVLIGDAFHAPCPASGTGMLRILHDVKRLTEAHLPAWLETPGHGRGQDRALLYRPGQGRPRQDLAQPFDPRARRGGGQGPALGCLAGPAQAQAGRHRLNTAINPTASSPVHP
ncbi:MAG: hypothetical protein WDN06_11020 [Asticcacaulis sp.]